MRIPFRRKALTIIAAIVSFTAIPAAGIAATATPALASINICNTYGGNWCIGAPTIGIGDPVELTATGRNINLVDRGYTCCGGYEVFQLQFAADTAKCVGFPSSPPVRLTVRYCSGGNSTNTNWALVPGGSDGSTYFGSTTTAGYLSSDNTLGHQLFLGNYMCSGCYLKWNI
jgi:hypothetical protein